MPAKYPDNNEIADHSSDVNKNIPLKRDTLFVNRIFLSSKLKFKVANKIWENKTINQLIAGMVVFPDPLVTEIIILNNQIKKIPFNKIFPYVIAARLTCLSTL